MQTQELLQSLLAAVERGGSAGIFLGRAYVSFYRGGDENKVNLRDLIKLDEPNVQIFFEMLTLRRRPNWSDDELYRAEQKIKAALEAVT